MSQDMPREKLASLVASFMSYSAGHLPDDVKLRLTQMSEVENEGFAPEIYKVMKKNMELADSLKRPSCQDTGIPQFFARVGANWPYMDIVEDALVDAVKEATAKAPLRPNAVEVFDEKNTGNNIGTHSPWIDWLLQTAATRDVLSDRRGGTSVRRHSCLRRRERYRRDP